MKKGRNGCKGEGVDVCMMIRSDSSKAEFQYRFDLPSRSSQKLILVCPRPIVYFPWLTPSNFSSSVWSTHCGFESVKPCMMTTGIEKIAEGVLKIYLTREIDLNGLDADVLGSRCHTGR